MRGLETFLSKRYPSYELFVKYNNMTNFLMRIKSNSFAKAKFLFAPHCEKKDVILDNGTVEVLATNVLDKSILQTSDFKELYALNFAKRKKKMLVIEVA